MSRLLRWLGGLPRPRFTPAWCSWCTDLGHCCPFCEDDYRRDAYRP